MFCEKCGKELREGVKFCPGCGAALENADENTRNNRNAPSVGNGTLTVYGYTEWYAVKPKVDILKNGVKIAEVNPGSMIEIPITENCTIQFKCMFRTATLQAYANENRTVRLSFNRITGELLINNHNQNPLTAATNMVSDNPDRTTTAGAGNGKSKTAAGLLGIFFGGLGLHKFYMGNIKMGILYLVFCWTYIPTIVGLIEGIMYLTETDEKFGSRCI